MKREVMLRMEGVPNPNAMRFVLENGVLVDKPYEFTSYAEAELSPLARKLLLLRYVDRVLLNRNYVTVVKKINQSPAWDKILYEIRGLILSHLEEDEPIMYLGAPALQHARSEDVIVEMINDLLDKKIRPAAQEDGGDILFDSYRNGILNLTMHGACHKCPYAVQTMKDGVEKVLTSLIPEVKQVTALENDVV